MIIFTANGRCAKVKADEPITTSSVGMPVSVVLSGDFDGLESTMVFSCGDVGADVALMGQDVTVPPQVLTQASQILMIGVYAALPSGQVVIPTVWANAGIVREGAVPSGVDPVEPTPSWVAQVQQWAEDAHDTAERLAQEVDGWGGEIDTAVSGAETVNATVSKSGTTATITVTDRTGTQHTATVSDGRDGAVGPQGQDGYSPTATVTQTATGATVTITDKDGTTTATIANGEKGETGATGATGATGPQGPAGDDYVITSADYAAIADVVEGNIQPIIEGAQDAAADATAAAAEARAASAATWLAGNVLFGELAEAAVLTADDVYTAPPKGVSVFGKSTQSGTPTPSSPVPILSVDALTLHASADGTTDYTNWPVQVPLSNHIARSLPDGTRDTLTLSYIGPSMEHEGWGIFRKALTQRTSSVTVSDLEWSKNEQYGYFSAALSDGADAVSGVASLRCSALSCATARSINQIRQTLNVDSMVVVQRALYSAVIAFAGTLADVNAFLTLMGNAEIDYPLATPTTIDLDEVELPILPNPLTAWADGGSAQPTMALEYERALSIVIPRIEAQLADMATS